VLERFKEKKEHTALVVDEFGGIAGLVTMNDVLEAIVGDIPSVEEEDQEPEVVRRADGSLLLDGMLSIHELKDVLQLKELPDEEQGDYETLSGLLMAQLGRIPITGDIYEWEQLKFEVVDMDGYRVDKVLVSTKR
jgi:putative hemolysin